MKLKDEVLWLLGIITLAALVNFAASERLELDEGISVVTFAPILEELLKFAAIRAGARPLFIGIGFQIAEAFVTGFPIILNPLGSGLLMTHKLFKSVHWMTAFVYDKRGAKWIYLALAICFHSIWNMFVYMKPPDDVLPLAGLIAIVMWILWQMRKESYA